MDRPPPASDLARLILLGTCYGLLSIASVTLTRFDGGAAFIWLASAPLLVALLKRPIRRWPGPLLCCATGSCVSTTVFGIGAWAALPMATVLMAEAALAAALLRWTRAERAPLDTVAGFGRFVAIVGVVVPGVGAIPAASIICRANGQPLASAAMPWFAAHALGFLTLVPLLLLVRERTALAEFRAQLSRDSLRIVTLLVLIAAVCIVTFRQNSLPLLFLPLLPLVVSAFVVGRLGAAAALIMLTVIGGCYTLTGHGPVALMGGMPGAKAQFFQFYLAVAVMMVLPVAAELRRREALFLRLQESEAGMRLLTDHLGDAILHTDAEGVIRFASPSLEHLSGISPAAITGRPHESIIVADDHATMQAARAAALADPDRTIKVDYRVHLPGARIGWRETQLRAYRDGDGRAAGVVLVVRDATERHHQVESLQRAASSDPLTGLANRRSFFEALEQRSVLAADGRTCLALFDIDHFKQINDRFGHAIGDSVLEAVATEAQHALRGSDLLARVGGEEFGVLLSDAALLDAQAACERLRQRVEALRVDTGAGHRVGVTVSIGLVPVPAGLPIAAIYEAADRALYAAKHGGRNQLRIAA